MKAGYRTDTTFFHVAAIAATAALLIAASGAEADSADVFRETFPKIGGIHINGNAPLWDPAYREALSKEHLVLLSFWKGYKKQDSVTGQSMSIADVVADIRRRAATRGNTGILIVQYTNFMELYYSPEILPLADLQEKIGSEEGPGGDWWARTPNGEQLSSYPGNYLTNITRFVTPDANGDTWPQWQVTRDYNVYFADGTFDAVFFDNFLYAPNQSLVDWDGDGVSDSKNDPEIRRAIRQGYVDGVQRFYSLTPNMFAMGNVIGSPGSGEGMLTEPEYNGLVVGFVEATMGLDWSTETWGGWALMMKQYQTTVANSRYGVGVMGAIGGADDYATVRYALTSCLMDNGYLMYSSGNSYISALSYDEFDVDLGRAIDPPQTSSWKQGVYMRRFEKGMAIVNPKGNGTQTLSVPSGYRRISGVQDPAVNNGQTVDTLTLPERDGIVLLAISPASRPKAPVLLTQQ